METTVRPRGGRLLHVVAIAAGALLALSACGDDSGGDSSTGPALSEEDFVAAYSEICSGTNEQIQALEAESFEESKTAAATASDIASDSVEGLQALQAPDDIADQADEGTDAFARTADVFGEMADADSEEQFQETAAGIDQALSDAQAALEPLGINCEQGDDGAEDSDAGETDSEDTDGAEGASTDGATPEPRPAADISDYGSDADLDALADACEGGDFDACDRVYLESDLGSGYEEYGATCGGRIDGPCVQLG